VSHIAVVGARVSRYSTSTRTPAIAAAPYDGRGASRGRDEVMASASKEGDRDEHEITDDEQHRCEPHAARNEVGIAGQEYEGSEGLKQASTVRPREGTRHEMVSCFRELKACQLLSRVARRSETSRSPARTGVVAGSGAQRAPSTTNAYR